MSGEALAQFASTKFSPATQTVNVGTNFSVDVVMTDPPGAYALSGAELSISFNAAKLQAISMTAGTGSPWTNVTANEIDNTNGKLRFKVTGGTINGSTVNVVKIVFSPIAAGTSVLDILNVNSDIVGYGPFGVNGLAVDGSVTINNVLPTQTLTILGGSGTPGTIDPYTQASRDGGATWQPAYLTGSHPWGFISGTNSWINFDPSPFVGLNSTTLYRVRFSVPADAVNPRFHLQLRADNHVVATFNGQQIGENYGESGPSADLVAVNTMQPGENTIYLKVADWGGWVGFNYRIDITMEASQPPALVPAPPADTTPPVITAPISMTKEATGPNGATVTYSPAPTATDNVSGSVPVTATPTSGSLFPLGTTTVQLSASDAAGNTATASFPVKVQDTTPPTLTVSGNVTAEATNASGAMVAYSAATASDAVTASPAITYSQNSGTSFPLGVTTVTVTATDAAQNAANRSFTVTVQDTTAPTIASVTPSNATLWPPNHQMVPITVSAVATDIVGITSLKIIGVTSNEPDNGLGDGDTADDIQITGDLTVNLRAERSGTGNGRVYTITVEARDAAGNASTKTCAVSVPLSQGPANSATAPKGKK